LTPDSDFFRALEAARTRALVERDVDAIVHLHAPEYELISPGGRVLTLATYLALIQTEPFYTAWEHGPMAVRVSEGMALLRYRARLTFPSGKVVECWHTDSYERRDSGWQAVWSQATQLPLATPPATDEPSDGNDATA
jgi:Domain of unknown function (DUF4440)